MSKTIGSALDREGGVRLEHRDRVAGRAGRDAHAGRLADGAQRRAAGQQHALGLDRSRASVSTADDPRSAAGVGVVRDR